MLRLIGFFIKLCLFSAFVLFLGNVIHYRGRTLSDQVRTSMAQVERQVERVDPTTLNSVRQWSKKLDFDSEPAKKSAKIGKIRTASGAQKEEPDRIPLSERQKLRALIRELNGSR